MVAILGGVLECRLFSEKTYLCRGRNFLSYKLQGGSSFRVSVWECSSSNSNNGTVHSDSENAGEKLTRKREDVILPSHIDKGRAAMGWWLPLFGWSEADLERWEEDDINESTTKGKAMVFKSSDDVENEIGGVPPKRSKSVRGRLTPEKEKLLRKNLRGTSTFHDTMYHSAIASRLASPDKEA